MSREWYFYVEDMILFSEKILVVPHWLGSELFFGYQTRYKQLKISIFVKYNKLVFLQLS